MDYLVDFKDSDDIDAKKAYMAVPGVSYGQVRINWVTLEQNEGVYVFPNPATDPIKILGEENVILMVVDKSFNSTDPNPAHIGSFVSANGGYTAYRWTTRYRRHFNALQRAIAKHYPNLGGIAYQESSTSVTGTSGMSTYNANNYRDILIEIIEQGLDLFKTVRWYFNYFELDNSSNGGPNYIRAVIDALAPPSGSHPDNLWIGGPDILPNDPNLNNLVYPIYDDYPNVNKFCSAQNATFAAYTAAQFPTEVIGFADTQLGVKMIPLSTVDWGTTTQISEVLEYVAETLTSSTLADLP